MKLFDNNKILMINLFEKGKKEVNKIDEDFLK